MLISSRREFLNITCRTLGAAGLFSRLGLMNALAQSGVDCSDYKALVCIFLFGGNDGTNTVVPISTPAQPQAYTQYAGIRQLLALPQGSLLAITTRDSRAIYGLHPRLTELHRLYGTGRLAVLLNVGALVKPLTRVEYQQKTIPLPVNLFSHSDQQAHWQSALPGGFATTGWAGRTADRMQSCNAPSTFPATVSLTGGNLFCTGQQTTPATVTAGSRMGLQGFGSLPNPRYTAYQQLLSFDNGLQLVQAANAVASAGVRHADLLNNALAGPSRITAPFPTTSIGQQLRQVARIIEARAALGMRRQIFFCSLGGFDTHNGQLPAHENLWGQLSPAMAAFYNATVELGVSGKVTTFTQSEFGRTCQPSSGGGSDHGWGGHHFILGDEVLGGDVYGTYPNLALGGPDDTASRGVYVPTLSLDQYGATLASWFGVGRDDLAALFPNLANFAPAHLGFLQRHLTLPVRSRGR